jgi:hypothetical protein
MIGSGLAVDVRARPVHVSVRHEQPADFLGREVRRKQLDRNAGADEQGGVPGEVREELLREVNGRRGDGNRVGADLGVRPHLLGHRKGVLQEPGQLLARRAGLLGLAVSLFQLAQDLRFAEHHGVEPTGHAKDMPNRFLALQREQGVGKTLVQVAVIVQPVLQALAAAIRSHHVEFRAVAGREQHRLVDALDVRQARQGLADLVTREDHLLANFDRCRVMVQPEYLQPHSR